MPVDYKQTDPRWNTNPYAGENINNAGCAPTAVADLIGTATPAEVAVWMQSHGYASNGYGTYWEGIPAALRAWGWQSTQLMFASMLGQRTSAVFDRFREHIQSGYCGVILFGNGGSPVKWTNGGHYVACVGYQDGKYLIYDPASDARTGWHDWNDFIPSIKILYTSTVPAVTAPADYAYKFETGWMHEGSSGNGVLLLQRVWRALGVYKSGYSLDGDFGKGTKEACMLWQKLRNLEQDGSAGYDTQRSLFRLRSETRDGRYIFYVKPVVFGAQGDSVILVQCLLKTLGFYNGAIDGDAGKQTREAIEYFQRAKRASGEYTGNVDGKAEKMTLKCLIEL